MQEESEVNWNHDSIQLYSSVSKNETNEQDSIIRISNAFHKAKEKIEIGRARKYFCIELLSLLQMCSFQFRISFLIANCSEVVPISLTMSEKKNGSEYVACKHVQYQMESKVMITKSYSTQ